MSKRLETGVGFLLVLLAATIVILIAYNYQKNYREYSYRQEEFRKSVDTGNHVMLVHLNLHDALIGKVDSLSKDSVFVSGWFSKENISQPIQNRKK